MLWGGNIYYKTGEGYRYTYLTPEIEVADVYGDMILEVEWKPAGAGSGIDNYGFDPPPGETCWQFAVFVPITLDRVKRIR